MPPAGEPPVKRTLLKLLFNVSNGNCNVITGFGITVIENCIGEPAHPSIFAITVTVDTIGVEVVLIVVKDGRLPIPEAGREPISGIGIVLLHCIVAPGVLVDKAIEGAELPMQ